MDVIRLCLTSEGYVGEGAAAGAGPFGVELYAHFPSVCSLQARDAVPDIITEKLSESFHHPETWLHVRVTIILQLLFLSQVFPA